MNDPISNQPQETPAEDQKSSSKWGGVRRGAGRRTGKANIVRMQIGIPLTPQEAEQLAAMQLSPGQRGYRLTQPANDMNLASAVDNRIQQNIRIVLTTEAERLTVLALSMDERRIRLLTQPPGGDSEDNRRGKWRNRPK